MSEDNKKFFKQLHQETRDSRFSPVDECVSESSKRANRGVEINSIDENYE